MTLSEKRDAYNNGLKEKAQEITELLSQTQTALNTLPGFFRADITENGVLVVMDRKDLKQVFDIKYGPSSYQINGVCFIGR